MLHSLTPLRSLALDHVGVLHEIFRAVPQSAGSIRTDH